MAKDVLLNRIIFVLGLIGIAIAVYVLHSYLTGSSIYCPAGGGCAAVRKSQYAWPLGIPVPAVGLVGYTIIVLLAFIRTLKTDKDVFALKGLLGMAGFGVIFVSWFTYTQATLIKSFCSWCLISAVNMYIIFALVLASWKTLKTPKSRGKA